MLASTEVLSWFACWLLVVVVALKKNPLTCSNQRTSAEGRSAGSGRETEEREAAAANLGAREREEKEAEPAAAATVYPGALGFPSQGCFGLGVLAWIPTWLRQKSKSKTKATPPKTL